MTDQIEQDQAAANDELSPAERLLLMEGQHRSLDQKIIELQSRPWQNQLLVQRLKKEKLRLKESIQRLKDEPQSGKRCPSWVSSDTLIVSPPVKPVSAPVLPTTR